MTTSSPLILHSKYKEHGKELMKIFEEKSNVSSSKSRNYKFTDDECLALLGAIESRIRFLDATIESESDGGVIEAATKDKELLEEVLEELGF